MFVFSRAIYGYVTTTTSHKIDHKRNRSTRLIQDDHIIGEDLYNHIAACVTKETERRREVKIWISIFFLNISTLFLLLDFKTYVSRRSTSEVQNTLSGF